MVISSAGESSYSTFSSRYVRDELPRYRMPENSIPKEAAYQIISDELMLDGNPRLNLASFVTTWMEPEVGKLIMDSVNKNYVDMDEYPVTTELQNRCVNMIAHLFNAPIKEEETAIGVATVGSSEAIMLAGLAFKRKWANKRKEEGKPYDKPNIVTGANVQVCWEKFARYFEVELKEVKLTEGYYVMDPLKAVEMVDENTICVAAILGSTLTGEYEDVKLLNDLLVEKNKKTGFNVPIHVDAASGGFIAPFLHPELEWDFRLPLVKSINVSGHKYGLVYPGVGWVIWRSKDDLPEELIFHINYLGTDQPTFTLNFSKGASQIIAQYYQLIRLGFEGYKHIMENCQANATALREGLEATGRFDILSKEDGVPLVAIRLKDSSKFSVFDISENLRRFGWIVPAYTMPADAEHVAVLRVVIREDFNRSLSQRLLADINRVVQELDAHAVHAIKMTTAIATQTGEGAEDGAVTKKSVLDIEKEFAAACKHWRSQHRVEPGQPTRLNFWGKKIPTASSLPTPRPRPKIPQPARSSLPHGRTRRQASLAPAALAGSRRPRGLAGSRRPRSLPLRAAPFPARPVPPPVRPSDRRRRPSGRLTARPRPSPVSTALQHRRPSSARPVPDRRPSSALPRHTPFPSGKAALFATLPGLKKKRLLHSPSSLSA